MKRMFTVFILMMMAVGGVISPNAAGAQSVAVEDTILTIAESEGWNYSIGSDGQPIINMVPMMINGEPQLDFAPAILDLYKTHQLLDAYAWSADILPDNYKPISTTIEIRVMSFADQENATQFLDIFYDQLMELSTPEANVTAINPLPDSDLNMLGITSMVNFTSYESGESMGLAGSVRYLAQIDNTVISVEVTGPLVDYNFDVAYALLDAQAGCVSASVKCVPITMPTLEDHWVLTENGLGFVSEGEAENVWARWIFPLKEPVFAPEISVTIP